MATLNLRPLSLGEILDRTFTLYRSNFLLFLGITAIPQLLVLTLRLAQLFLIPSVAPGTAGIARSAAAFGASIIVGIVAAIVNTIAYLLSQGATVSAVADLYLGRTPTIGASFQKVRGDLGTLFGVVVLNGLVVLVGFILLVIPGIYMMCRLLIAVPAAVLEDLGARNSLDRSFALTKDNAGRAFVILLLYFVLLIMIMSLFQFPATFGLAAAKNNPAMFRMWMAIIQVLASVSAVLVTPFLTIATSALYFDLRVRREAFDLQVMLNPGGAIGPAGGVPSVLG
jgi:glycerophosphoryl diester phosphodiesterase family protein